MTMMMFLASIASGQQKPVTGYAPVNGLKMYYEIKGSGEPVVLLHGAFMAITDDWRLWINELAKTRKVIAVEMQGHGRTADIKRDINYDNLGDDVAALLDYLKIDRAIIRDIDQNLGNQTFLRGLCTIAHTMGMMTIAEGVETEQQARFFSEARCDEFQGFLFCRPLPVDRLELHMATASKAGGENHQTVLNSVRGLLQTS